MTRKQLDDLFRSHWESKNRTESGEISEGGGGEGGNEDVKVTADVRLKIKTLNIDLGKRKSSMMQWLYM